MSIEQENKIYVYETPILPKSENYRKERLRIYPELSHLQLGVVIFYQDIIDSNHNIYIIEMCNYT